MSVRHEKLRMIERSALEDDTLVGERLQEGDERIDLVRVQCGGRDAERLDDRTLEFVDGRYVAPASIQLDYLTKCEHVAIVKVRRGERYVAERRNFKRALHTKALVHDGAIKCLADGSAVRKEPARQRERSECIGRADAEVVVGRTHADVVETFVDDVAVAIAHRPVRGEGDATDGSIRELVGLMAVRAADVAGGG